MLTLVTLATFLLELCSTSPVYNLQPAFITGHIGTINGRNIRNLPCISRKNNQSGVCMFAIDCLKSNGTHLGTCIDRFYFGSCCHIEPVHDIIENSIDTDIIPHREPPHRISSTTLSTISSSTLRPSTSNIGDSVVNVINKLGSLNQTSEKIATTEKTTTTTFKSTGTTIIPIKTTTNKIPPSTTTDNLITTKFKTSTTTEKPETTTAAEKLQTFQTVDGNVVPETTTKGTQATRAPTKSPVKLNLTTTTFKPATSKPILIIKPSTKPVKPSVKPKPARPEVSTSKPVKTTKPVKVTKPAVTKRPLITTTEKITTEKSTAKPAKITTTVKPISTKPITTRQPIKTTAAATTKVPLTTTIKLSTSTVKIPEKLPSITTVKPVKVSTTESSVILTTQQSVSVNKQQITTNQPLIVSTLSNEVPVSKLNVSSLLETVNGNPATNEIEAAQPNINLGDGLSENSTDKPGLVTWTIHEEKKNASATTSNPAEVSLTTEEWVPITTPDGWVLPPSVSPVTHTPIPAQNSTSPFPVSSTVSPEKTTIFPKPPPKVNTTTGGINVTTTSPKPSITYIPLQEASGSIGTSLGPLVPSSGPLETSAGPMGTTFGPTSTDANDRLSTTTQQPIVVSSTTMASFMETLATTMAALDLKPVNMSDFTDVCGRRMFPEARIVGGEKSRFGKWPWQISLRQWRTSTYLHKCGAALLNENWAITAAHCVDNVAPSDLLLRLGEHDLSTEGEPYLHQERRVQIVASHPQFDPRTFEYDLALLRFYEPVTFQPNILPVCVPQTDENFVGRNAHVTGWGRLYEDGPLPSILQEVSVPVINNTVCESMYRSAGYIEHIPHIFICAGWRKGGFDSCEGDSGGPMVIQREDKRFLLAGVISWGIGCAEPNQPGVYTRISEFRDWINQILQF